MQMKYGNLLRNGKNKCCAIFDILRMVGRWKYHAVFWKLTLYIPNNQHCIFRTTDIVYSENLTLYFSNAYSEQLTLYIPNNFIDISEPLVNFYKPIIY